jgi:hypothetical protein
MSEIKPGDGFELHLEPEYQSARDSVALKATEMIKRLPKSALRKNLDTPYWFRARLYAAITEGDDTYGWNADGIERALATLSEREQIVLELRFRYALTFENVGKLLYISRERVRQLEVKALRKLRLPARFSLLSAEGTASLLSTAQSTIEKLTQENEFLRSLGTVTSGVDEALQVETDAGHKSILNMSIDDMGLSIRSSNCLHRANCHTVGDIMKRGWARLRNVRNLGAKSFNEVISKLDSLNLHLEEEGDINNG